MRSHKGIIVTKYARMWPREVFNIKEGAKLITDIKHLLSESGVYVLYREDQPYYVGKAQRLFKRLHDHANNPRDKYYNFWNFFCAFVVPNIKHLEEIEGILVASMPTDNSAVRRIKKIFMPNKIASLIRAQRVIKSANSAKEK